MSERFTCPQGHQWDDAHWTGTQRNLCPYCGAEPAPRTAIEESPVPRSERKTTAGVEDLPSVVAAESPPSTKPKAKRGVGALALFGCFLLIVAVVALVAGGGGWYYYSARQMAMRRARSVVEKRLDEDYRGNHWKIESESMSPGLTEASFEGKGDPEGFGFYNHKFTIIVSKYNDGRWHIDE